MTAGRPGRERVGRPTRWNRACVWPAISVVEASDVPAPDRGSRDAQGEELPHTPPCSTGRRGECSVLLLLHSISGRAVSFLVAQAGFHRLHGREMTRSFSLPLAAGCRLPPAGEIFFLCIVTVAFDGSMERFRGLSEMTLHLFCGIQF